MVEGRDGPPQPAPTVKSLSMPFVGAIREGGLFAVDIDIIHNEMGKQAHVVLRARNRAR